MNAESEIVILPDRAALAVQAAERFVSIARNAVVQHGRFSIALSGGSTPRDLYALLATPRFSTQVDWALTYVFFGDERRVPPDHPDSNYRMAKESLLSRVPIPQENVHRIHAEQDPDIAARDYGRDLQTFFTARSLIWRGKVEDSRELPHFDLILLGLGEDAHTASLFPHTAALSETVHWVAANYVEKLNTYRITLTPTVINAAANILFLVAGADKAAAVQAVLHSERRPDDLPAQLIQPTSGRVVWLLDQAASEKLNAND